MAEAPPPLAVPRPDEATPADEQTMARETARHVGHVDITRELLGGRTGR